MSRKDAVNNCTTLELCSWKPLCNFDSCRHFTWTDSINSMENSIFNCNWQPEVRNLLLGMWKYCFDMKLVEFPNAKPAGMRDTAVFIEKTSICKWIHAVQTPVVWHSTVPQTLSPCALPIPPTQCLSWEQKRLEKLREKKMANKISSILAFLFYPKKKKKERLWRILI